MVSFDPETAVLRVSGEEDRTTIGYRRRALSAALKATKDVVVDLTDLRFADTTVMIDLAVLARRLRLKGACLRLRSPQPQVARVIEVVGLHRQPAVAFETG